MSKRLQVLLPPAEFLELRQKARRKGQTVAAWVREALRRAAQEEPDQGPERKLAALRTAVKHDFPTADIGEMLAQIERGRTRVSRT